VVTVFYRSDGAVERCVRLAQRNFVFKCRAFPGGHTNVGLRLGVLAMLGAVAAESLLRKSEIDCLVHPKSLAEKELE